jgi:DNA-binding MarR family transcriptional regulator
MVRPPLALVLLRASRWFDLQLLDALEERGWPRLSAAQSLVFAYLSADGTPPAELARRLGTSRQAAHELVAGLDRLGLLEVVDDPGRSHGRLVVLTGAGRALAHDARGVLAGLEESLGPESVEALHELLGPLAGADAGRAGTPPPLVRALRGVPTYRRTVTSSAGAAGRRTEEDAVTESPDTVPDGPHPQGTGIREDGPTLSGLPDDAPDELRLTLSGGNLGHIPTDAERGDEDR